MGNMFFVCEKCLTVSQSESTTSGLTLVDTVHMYLVCGRWFPAHSLNINIYFQSSHFKMHRFNLISLLLDSKDGNVSLAFETKSVDLAETYKSMHMKCPHKSAVWAGKKSELLYTILSILGASVSSHSLKTCALAQLASLNCL